MMSNFAVDVDGIATICYNALHANNAVQIPWEALPQWKKLIYISSIHFQSMAPHTLDEIHNHWVSHMTAQGWVYGLVYDPVAKEHPSILPLDSLAPADVSRVALLKAICDSFIKVSDTPIKDVGSLAPALYESLEWALHNIDIEPNEWVDDECTDAHRQALDTLNLYRGIQGKNREVIK